MYSRTSDRTYVRDRGVQVPPNYSGSAFPFPPGNLPGSQPGDPPGGSPGGDLPVEQPPRPDFRGLPQIGTFSRGDDRQTQDAPPPPAAPPVSGDDAGCPPPVPAPAPAPRPSAPSLFDGSHFPLGHGLGQEEIVLIGLCLLLLHEGSESGGGGDLWETLLLLGALLLCG